MIFDACENTKQQGDVGLAVALSRLTAKGYSTLVPFGDNRPDYDFVFDNAGEVQRVQVRTTSERNRNKNKAFVVHLQVKGGNQSFHTSKSFDNTKVDWLFVLTADGQTYLIPSKDIFAKTYLTLNESMNKFKF